MKSNVPKVDKTARIKKNATTPQPPSGVGNPGSHKVDAGGRNKQPGVKKGGY